MTVPLDLVGVFNPNPLAPFEEQDETTLLAMLIWGEARGQRDEVKIAVASVVRNRVRHPESAWGKTLRSVILAPYQFSCFNRSDPNRPQLLSPTTHDVPTAWARCYRAANLVLAGAALDPSLGADHYFDVSIAPPAWAAPERRTAALGRLLFYRLDQPMSPAPAAPPAKESVQ